MSMKNVRDEQHSIQYDTYTNNKTILFQNGFKFKERKTFIGDKDLYFKYAVHHKTEKPRNRPRVAHSTAISWDLKVRSLCLHGNIKMSWILVNRHYFYILRVFIKVCQILRPLSISSLAKSNVKFCMKAVKFCEP